MNIERCRKWGVLGVRLALGVIFCWAGIAKLGNVPAFAQSIEAYQLVPQTAVNLMALSLPPLEIMTGLLLISGYVLRAALLAAIFLLVIFVVALAQAAARGLVIDCGCFGSEAVSAWTTWLALGRDMALLGLALWVYLRQLCAPDMAQGRL